MIWVNGQRDSQASISPLDHGFTVGDGVFETVKTINGEPFALTRHLHRLRASAEGMFLPAPDDQVVRAAISQVLSEASYPIGRLRITWTSGSGGAGSRRADPLEPTLVITHNAASPWPENAKIVTMNWLRNESSPLVHLKTISYAENVMALELAHRQGADEAIFFNQREQLSEGTGSNLIVRIKEQWLTPPLSAGVLAGVTRALAIEWLGVEEVDVSRTDFLNATEIVLSSSTRDLQAVGWVNGAKVAGTESSSIRHLIDNFVQRAGSEIDP